MTMGQAYQVLTDADVEHFLTNGFVVIRGCFTATPPGGAARPGAEAPGPPPGWQKTGDFFRHYLDSPEQGLLTLVLWTDVVSQGGGTFVAADSVPVIARLLAEHPEGLLPGDFDYHALIRQCHDFVEITGTVGDVVLI